MYLSLSLSLFLLYFQLKSASNLQLARFRVRFLVSLCRKCNQMCAHARHYKSNSDSDSNSYSDSESLIIGIVNFRQSLAENRMKLSRPNPKRDNVARLMDIPPYKIPDFNLYGLINLKKTCLRCKIDRYILLFTLSDLYRY